MSDSLDQILADDFLGDLASIDIADLRARRARCQDVETGLSYMRRLVQGRLDVVTAELERRAEGGDLDDLQALIDRLPTLLAGSTRSPGTGRLPQSFGTGEVDVELSDELDDIITNGHLDDPGSISDVELTAAQAQLTEFEHKVSGLRRQLFDRIDAVETELTRRYRTGEATVDSLLS